MSKTIGNVVDPLQLAEELGADVVRYTLLRAIAFGQDGDFDHAAVLERYNAELGKNIGNLLNRVLGLCTKMTDGRHPPDDPATDGALERELDEAYAAAVTAARQHWENLAPHVAIEQTLRLSSAANAYVDRAAPWAEAKTGNRARIDKILSRLLRVLEALGTMLWPAMPTKSDALRAQLGLGPLTPAVGLDAWPTQWPPVRAGLALAPAGPLFPTYDDEAQKALLARLMPHPMAHEVHLMPHEAHEVYEAGAPAPQVTAPTPATSPAPTAPSNVAPPITYDDFERVDLRVGVVLTCEKIPKKDKLLKLTVDLGEELPRQIVAGLALSFSPEVLVGQRVVVVANLAPRDFGKGLVSHGMIVAAGPSEALALATVPESIAPGTRLK